MPSVDFENLTELEKRILEAAAKEFDTKGFHGVNIDEVAAGLSIGKGTIYRHFGNKTSLFLYVVHNAIAGAIRGAEDVENWHDFETGLNLYIDKVIQFTKLWGSFFLVMDSPDNMWVFKKEIDKNKSLKGHIHAIMENRKKAVIFMSRIIDAGKREGRVPAEVDSMISADIVILTVNQFSIMLKRQKSSQRKVDYNDLFTVEDGYRELRKFIFRALGAK